MEKDSFNDHADPVSVLKAMIAITTSEDDYANGYRDGLRRAISILTIADATEKAPVRKYRTAGANCD